MLHYPDPEHIWPGSEAFLRLNRLLAEQRYSKVVFLVDENTHQQCLPLMLAGLDELSDHEILEIPAGEDSKSPEILIQLWRSLSEMGIDRKSILINLGGGVITDLGGFAAGTYLRGISFVNIPTSLLAMVDASLGGKTGINLDQQKNRVGLFLEPRATCIIHDFLDTLPSRERRSGFAEMLKHGLISDYNYWQRCLEVNIDENIPDSVLILESIKLKKEVVDADFRESGKRKILNFGHSIGHAIEALSLQSEQPLLHGEAIALGMMAELELSARFAGLTVMEAKVITEQLARFFPDLHFNTDVDQLITLMRGDKKNEANAHHFTLLDKPGWARPDVIVPEEGIIDALRSLNGVVREA